MKVAFVVGFFDPVKDQLKREFPRQLETGSIFWISQGKGQSVDITEFKTLFYRELNKKPESVCVLIAVIRDYEWAKHTFESIVEDGRAKLPSCQISLSFYDDRSAATRIASEIAGIGFSEIQEVTFDQVKAKLKGSKVICVVADGQTPIKAALARGGFSSAIISEFFDEENVATGKNSTLMEHLQTYTKTYSHMLYAWKNLRTSGPGLVKAFRKSGIFYEAESAAKVVEMFRKWILS